MNFKEMQDEVIRFRFDERRRESVKQWINLRYGAILAMGDWPWVFQFSTGITLTAGAAFTTMPASTIRVLRVTDRSSNEDLSFMELADLESLDSRISEDTGQPTAWTEWKGNETTGPQIQFDFFANNDYDYTVTYLARPGPMSADDDEPVFPEQYHYLLVQGAMATGLKMENDPTWDALEAEFNAMVDVMRNEILPPDRPENREFGRDMLGYEDISWL